MGIIRLKNVSKFYYSKGIIASGISKVNLDLDLGEFVVITGESGSGKSTLMRLLLGLVFPEKGSVKLCPVCPAGDRDMADPSGSVDFGTDGPDDISSKDSRPSADICLINRRAAVFR